MFSHTFELNCFITPDEFRLSNIVFKELELISTLDYQVLREVLHGTEAIWYALGSKIYLVGDERELRQRLSSCNISAGAAWLVEYSEMLSLREPALRAILHAALARLMIQNGFRPSISRSKHSFYPYFDSRDDVQVTFPISGEGFTALLKDGLQFAFDLSPEGRALLWIDVKVFAFVHFQENDLESGRPVYVFCSNPGCPIAECETLIEGAFIASSDTVEALSDVSCTSVEASVPVVSKVGGEEVLVPHQWIYTTADTKTLRELGIYDRWRSVAIRPAPSRHEVVRNLIGLIANDTDSLAIPFPEGQSLIFSLSPIKFTRELRWSL